MKDMASNLMGSPALASLIFHARDDFSMTFPDASYHLSAIDR